VDALLQQSTSSSIDFTHSNVKAVLHYEAAQEHILNHLLTAGANPMLEDDDGKSPFRVAQEEADGAAKLLQEKQDPTSLSQGGDNCSVFAVEHPFL